MGGGGGSMTVNCISILVSIGLGIRNLNHVAYSVMSVLLVCHLNHVNLIILFAVLFTAGV